MQIDRGLRILVGLIRATRYAPKLLALVVVSVFGLLSAQGASDPNPDESETTERTVAYRHYL